MPGPAPAGASARYEPEFEKLSAEIAKLESPEGRASLKWDLVIESCSAILKSKSKDLLVASYLTMGLYQKNSYAGLLTGLTICRDLHNTFWDGLFPEKARLRARAAALQWMSERISPAIAEKSAASKSNKDALTACSTLLDELGTISGEKYGDSPPDLGELSRVVRDKLDSIPEDKPAEEAKAETTSEAPSSSGGGVGPVDVSSPEAARAAIPQLAEQRVKVALALRGATPTDPLPYRMLRSALWEDIVELPPATDGVIPVTGADTAFGTQADELLNKGEFQTLLTEAESRMGAAPIWLDLNLFVYRAMEGLGRPYQNARRVVAEETAAFVRRIPAMLELKFQDGVPMASEATRMWLLHEVSGPSSGGSNGKASALDTAVSEARKLIARKQFADATGLVLKELEKAAHRRDRFLCRLGLAKLCVEGGRPELALPQLLALDEEARKFSLDEWEPALAADLVRELWKVTRASQTPEKAEVFYSRLCHLDPAAALAANGLK